VSAVEEIFLLFFNYLAFFIGLLNAVYQSDFIDVLFGDNLCLFEVDLDPTWQQFGF